MSVSCKIPVSSGSCEIHLVFALHICVVFHIMTKSSLTLLHAGNSIPAMLCPEPPLLLLCIS